MKKRSTEILQGLLHEKNSRLNLENLLETFYVTKKTLRKDVREIKNFLEEQGYEEAIWMDDRELVLDYVPKKEIHQAIYGMDAYIYKMSLEERKIYIILTLLYCKDFYTMQRLADELYVTRNTIINDCKIVERYLEQFGISLYVKSKRGIRLEYEQEDVILMLVDMFHTLIPTAVYEKTFFVQYVVEKISFSTTLAAVIQQMNQYTRESSILFANEVFYEIAICLYVLLNRIQQKALKTDEEEDLEIPVDAISHMIQWVANQLNIIVEKQEIIFIEKIILDRGVYLPAQSINDFELYGVICHFLLEIGNQIDVSLQTDDLLIRSLLSHMKSMKNWGNIELEIEPQYTSSLEFVQIRQIADDKFYILERYLMYQLNDFMKNSIIIHICAALLRDWESVGSYRVIVSCPGSMATSKYLEAQIKNYFNFTIVDVMKTKEIERVEGKFVDIDFIISTVPIKKSILPVIVVNPLITIEDISKIQQVAFQNQERLIYQRRNMSQTQLEEYPMLSELLVAYMDQNNNGKKYIDRKLQTLLHEVKILKKKEYHSELLSMMNPKYIMIADGPVDWKDAMLDLAQDMMFDDIFEADYVEEAINNVEEYGSYIIVNQGIALAHASDKTGTCKEAIGLLVASEGIHFDDGASVELLFFFSPESDTDYLNLFKEIIELGNDQEQFQKIKYSSSCEEIYQYMEEVLEK